MGQQENPLMEPHGKSSAVTSKLNTLLRMGLVSKNNVRRAQTLFADPDRAMKNPAYRMLMQEILVDVVDRVLNNKMLYTALRNTLGKEPATVIEGVEEERAKTLLRSGLVKKKDVVAARRALKSPATAKGMSASKVYRDMMIDMMDSMVKKITGSPVLFNAFKQTLGKEEMEESFEVPNAESIAELLLHEDATELVEKNVPTKPDLWARAKSKARSKFDVYPSAYANGWAVKWYNEQGGGWKSTNECKTFFEFAKTISEGRHKNWVTSPNKEPRPVGSGRKVKNVSSVDKTSKKEKGLGEAWGAAAQGKAWWQNKTRAELDALAKSASEARRGEEDEKRKRHAAWNKTQKWSSITGKKPVKEEAEEIDEGSAVPSRKEALAAIRWGKKAMKDPAKHNVTPEDIRANMQVARDTLRPFGAKRKPVKEARWEGSAAQAKLKKAKAEYEKHAAEIKKPIPPSRGSYHPMARQDPKTGKMYWAKDRRKKAGTGSRRATDADYRSDSTTE